MFDALETQSSFFACVADCDLINEPNSCQMFVREPPDGCEKVKIMEESRYALIFVTFLLNAGLYWILPVAGLWTWRPKSPWDSVRSENMPAFPVTNLPSALSSSHTSISPRKWPWKASFLERLLFHSDLGLRQKTTFYMLQFHITPMLNAIRLGNRYCIDNHWSLPAAQRCREGCLILFRRSQFLVSLSNWGSPQLEMVLWSFFFFFLNSLCWFVTVCELSIPDFYKVESRGIEWEIIFQGEVDG